MSAPPRLPRAVAWLLRRAAGPLADEVEGDLREWMTRWREEVGSRRARLRGIRTSLGMTPRLALGRATDALLALRDRAPGAGWSLDAKLALRLLARTPGLSLVAVVALAVTMGLATSLFTLTHAALYTDLPVPEGDRVVVVDVRDAVTRRSLVPTFAEYRAWSEGVAALDHTGAFAPGRLNVAAEGAGVQALPGARITPSVFDFNPVAPLLGSLFSDRMVAETPRVALIGEPVWTSHFARDPDVVGRTLEVNGVDHRVVGVLPGSWAFPADEVVWVPLTFPTAASPDEHHPGMYTAGRLAEGASLERASAESEALIRAATTLPDRTAAVDVRPFARGFTDPAEVPLFFGAIGALVLLVVVAAANVANLVLARTEARRAELAVRSALGASRGRIVGQLFVEALALTTVAAALATLLSGAALAWVERFVDGIPYYMSFRPSPAVVVFAAALAGLAAVVAGVVPALRSTRGGMAEGVRSSRSVGFGRFSRTVIVAEVAVSLALLGTAFAVGQSLRGYTRGSVTPLADEEIVTATLYAPWEGALAEEEEVGDFSARLRAGIRREMAGIPGARVGFTLDLPGTEAQASRVELEGEEGIHPVRGVSVDDGFFRAVDVAARPGRTFRAGDLEEDASPVVLVNEPFVDDVLGGRNALGRRLRFHYGDGTRGGWAEVVGVVPDLGMNPADPAAGAAVYRPMPGTNYARVVLRGAAGDPFTLVPVLREAAFRVDPRVQLRDARLLRDAAADERALLTGIGTALFALGAMALLLSTAGLYAVISFGVERRTREIGVRVALGADARRVVQSVGARVARDLASGLVLGVAVGWLFLRVVDTLEFTIRAEPLLHLGGPALLLVAAGMLSVWRPLARALAVQPAEALRAE